MVMYICVQGVSNLPMFLRFIGCHVEPPTVVIVVNLM